MFDVVRLTGPFFAEAQEISRSAQPQGQAKKAKSGKEKKKDDDDGPGPTAGAVARLFPFLRPRPWGLALA